MSYNCLYHPLSFALVAALGLTGCGGPSPYQRVTQDSATHVEGSVQSGKQVGTWTYSRQNGSKQAEGQWLNDHQSGPWSYRRADNSLEAQVTYQMGLRQGWGTYFHPNGALSSEGNYWMDRQNGYWRFFSTSKQPLAAGSFNRGARALEWNFADKRSGCYSDGHKVGWWVENGSWKDYGVPSHAQLHVNHNKQNNQHWYMTWKDSSLSVKRDNNGSVQEIILDTPESILVQLGSAGKAMRALGHFTNAGAAEGHWILFTQEPAAEVHVHFQSDKITHSQLRMTADSTGAFQTLVSSNPTHGLVLNEVDGIIAEVRGAREQAGVPTQEISEELITATPELTLPEVTITPVIAEPVGFTIKEIKQIDFAEKVYAGKASFEESDDYIQASKPDYSSSKQAQAWLGAPLQHPRFLAENGSVLNLQTYQDNKRVLMVVLRGFAGSVCPYCTAQTRALMKRIDDFKSADCEVVFVYPGSPSSIPSFLKSVSALNDTQKKSIRILLDIDLVFIRSLGIEEKLAKPTSIIVDGKGLVQYAYIGKDLADRPTVDHLLKTVKGSSL